MDFQWRKTRISDDDGFCSKRVISFCVEDEINRQFSLVKLRPFSAPMTRPDLPNEKLCRLRARIVTCLPIHRGEVLSFLWIQRFLPLIKVDPSDLISSAPKEGLWAVVRATPKTICSSEGGYQLKAPHKTVKICFDTMCILLNLWEKKQFPKRGPNK